MIRSVIIVVFLLKSLLFITDALAASVKTIGIIYSADIQHYRNIHVSVMRNLRILGLDEKSIQFIEQRPQPNVISWANSVRKLIAYDSDLILAYGSGATVEALSESSSIPVVFGGVYGEPHRIQNQKNAHGCFYRVPLASFFRYLKNAKDIRDVAVVYSPFEIDSMMQYDGITKISDNFSIRIIGIPFKNINGVRTQLNLKMYDALFVTGSAWANYEIEGISDICKKKNIPLMTIFEGAEEYSFLAITPDTDQEGMDLAKKIYDLIKGKSSDEPRCITVTKTKICFNLKLATELGLRIPINLVTSSDRVIR